MDGFGARNELHVLHGCDLFLIPDPISRIYTPDPVVIHAAGVLLYVAAFFQLFDGMQTVATGALRGAGDTRTPMLCHLILYWGIGLPLGAYLCFRLRWGAPGCGRVYASR